VEKLSTEATIQTTHVMKKNMVNHSIWYANLLCKVYSLHIGNMHVQL